MSDRTVELSPGEVSLAERIRGLRADGFTWSQVSRQLAINIDRAKDLVLTLLAEADRKQARRAKVIAIAKRPKHCRYRVRRDTVWENRCENGLGPCTCQQTRGNPCHESD